MKLTKDEKTGAVTTARLALGDLQGLDIGIAVPADDAGAPGGSRACWNLYCVEVRLRAASIHLYGTRLLLLSLTVRPARPRRWTCWRRAAMRA